MSERFKTYISLFSGAGVGCYGFKQAGFKCVATAEVIERRLNIQRHNHKCDYESGYICADMTTQYAKQKIFEEIELWKHIYGISGIDVVIATPPCQGMSVANHKKKNELGRNSLVVESIKLIREINPAFFIFENVRTFLKSVCTDIDGINKTIDEAIEKNLSGKYNIVSKVLNFKDYGCPSSRTRTLVIGSHKNLHEITPFDLFPAPVPENTLRETIGYLPPLTTMGEICPSDIYHNFKSYPSHMMEWVAHIKEGESAFDNKDKKLIPWSMKNGVKTQNVNKNGDKYKRQFWDMPAPCIHTRNDIMASQNTVHPRDNRVFSIREVMLMMSVPASFQWSDKPEHELNALDSSAKVNFLKKEEMNIRQGLGEAVPTAIFRQIADKIADIIPIPPEKDIKLLIAEKNLDQNSNLKLHIKNEKCENLPLLFKTIELANNNRNASAAYYTRQDICFSIIKHLPSFSNRSEIKILEPAVGAGNFLPLLARHYSGNEKVTVDVIDIDPDSLNILKCIVSELHLPKNIKLNFICDDFLLCDFINRYDVVIGNPPFGKVKDKLLLSRYRSNAINVKTANMFSFFVEKALKISETVALIMPKSLISSPEFDDTRDAISNYAIKRIVDYGEKAFKGVKIETVSILINTIDLPDITTIESYITWENRKCRQDYIIDPKFPNWLLYRSRMFDDISRHMQFNIFTSWRDRVITRQVTKDRGSVRVLKSRNIGNNKIIDIPGYDCWLDELDGLDAAKFLNKTNCILVPNLTYSPRACFMPKGCIADGSVAILTPKTGNKIAKSDLAYYATDDFSEFYGIARNRGSRSLNIDRNSVFYFGKRAVS